MAFTFTENDRGMITGFDDKKNLSFMDLGQIYQGPHVFHLIKANRKLELDMEESRAVQDDKIYIIWRIIRMRGTEAFAEEQEETILAINQAMQELLIYRIKPAAIGRYGKVSVDFSKSDWGQ